MSRSSPLGKCDHRQSGRAKRRSTSATAICSASSFGRGTFALRGRGLRPTASMSNGGSALMNASGGIRHGGGGGSLGRELSEHAATEFSDPSAALDWVNAADILAVEENTPATNGNERSIFMAGGVHVHGAHLFANP